MYATGKYNANAAQATWTGTANDTESMGHVHSAAIPLSESKLVVSNSVFVVAAHGE